MKLPALTIAATFVCGIVLGLCPPLPHLAESHRCICMELLTAGALLLCGFWLAASERLRLAASASLLCWLALGLLSAAIAQQPLPSNHIVNLVNSGRIDLHAPLRWHGHLRDEPTFLPWGRGYEIELSGVEVQGALLPTTGGLRLSYTEQPEAQQVAPMHAGDALAVLVQAKRPQVFRDEGAFDRRAYLEQQNIHLVATLRAPQLLERTASGPATMATRLARARRRLREEIDTLFGADSQVDGVLRAMLLGDRNFVDRDEASDFQKTATFHVLAVAGLHVGALAAFLFFLARKLKLSPGIRILCTVTLLFAYVAIVEQRSPVLRAAWMATLVVLGGFFYRRLELMNSAALAAVLLLVWKPLAIRDSSFQLTFLAMGCIAGLSAPWLRDTAEPYVRALQGWRDVTRDAAHAPRVIQFRIDLRTFAQWSTSRLPQRWISGSENTLISGIAVTLRIWELLVITLVLQMGMLPLMANDFHRLTLSAPLANLWAVPLTGIIIPMGFLVLLSGLVSSWFGKLLAIPLKAASLLLLQCVHMFARMPKASYRIPGPPAWLMILFFSLLILLIAAMHATRFRMRSVRMGLLAGLTACGALAALFPFAPRRANGKLEMTVLDVGQGDSLFLVSPRGGTMLIDGGGAFMGFPGHEDHGGIDPGEEAVSPYLWSRGFQKLDVVAVTHAHQDHLGGLAAVLENFRVGKLWIGKDAASPALIRLESMANEKHIPIEHEYHGKHFVWDGVDGEIFWPEAATEETPRTPKNNDSLVLRLQYGQRTLFLPGDAEKEAERSMLRGNASTELRADVLKVGHHGSKNSTSSEFLTTVQPSVAIISVGAENSYGHPHPEVLDRLQWAHARVLRTDRDGAVHFLTDGHTLEISCFEPCPGQPTESVVKTNQ